MAKLTAVEVRKASHDGAKKGPVMLPDGDGLYLQITPAKSKSWVFRYTIRGKARMMGLGAFGESAGGVSLSKARVLAGQARALLAQHKDPLEVRREAEAAETARRQAEAVAAVTFRTVATDYIAAHEAGWKNKKHAAQWTSTLTAFAYPVFGDLPVAAIDADAVEQVLKPLWLRVPETASRLRGRIEAVLDYARAKGLRQGDNPARWRESMKHRLPNVAKVKRTGHHPALPWHQIGPFMAELRAKKGTAAKALGFAILTAARSGEVRGACWSEIDMEAATWTIPAVRMKGGREHRVPLSKAALKILSEQLPLSRGPASLIFPAANGRSPLSDMALSMLLRGMNEVAEGEKLPWCDARGEAVVPHGFRSTFRDWCEEATSTPHAVCEAALAHAVADKVEAAYRRSDLFEKRTALMTSWAEQCERMPAKVVTMDSRKPQAVAVAAG